MSGNKNLAFTVQREKDHKFSDWKIVKNDKHQKQNFRGKEKVLIFKSFNFTSVKHKAADDLSKKI